MNRGRSLNLILKIFLSLISTKSDINIADDITLMHEICMLSRPWFERVFTNKPVDPQKNPDRITNSIDILFFICYIPRSDMFFTFGPTMSANV